MERSIEGFRGISVQAIGIFIRRVGQTVSSLLDKLYAIHSGTGVVLDLVGILEDSLASFEQQLPMYHLKVLTMECLLNVVAYHIAPFVPLEFDSSHFARGAQYIHC